MSKRKTAQQRIEEYRIKADKLEAAAKRRALRQSPQWKLTLAAMDKLTEAGDVLVLGEDYDRDHAALIDSVCAKLRTLALDRVL